MMKNYFYITVTSGVRRLSIAQSCSVFPAQAASEWEKELSSSPAECWRGRRDERRGRKLFSKSFLPRTPSFKNFQRRKYLRCSVAWIELCLKSSPWGKFSSTFFKRWRGQGRAALDIKPVKGALPLKIRQGQKTKFFVAELARYVFFAPRACKEKSVEHLRWAYVCSSTRIDI